MVFGPSIPEPDMLAFARKDWITSEHGLDLKEELPPCMPQPHDGFGFMIWAYVDADHASNSSVTRRSHTVVSLSISTMLLFIGCQRNRGVFRQVPLVVYDISFIWWVFLVKTPLLVHLRWQSVCTCKYMTIDSWFYLEEEIPEYHFFPEGSAKDESRTVYVNNHLNPADLFTKPLKHGAKRISFVWMVLHHIFASIGSRMTPQMTTSIFDEIGFLHFMLLSYQPRIFDWIGFLRESWMIIMLLKFKVSLSFLTSIFPPFFLPRAQFR